MRLGAIILTGALAACSAAKADSSDYGHAVRCEVLTAVVGASHPGLSRSEIGSYVAHHDEFAEAAARMGRQLGKTPLNIDEDRLQVVNEMKRRGAEGGKGLDPLIAESRVCAGLS